MLTPSPPPAGLPPAPPAGLPPPKRRFVGRRLTSVPSIIAFAVLIIVTVGFIYNLYQRSQDQLMRRAMAETRPSGADASSILNGKPDGFIHAKMDRQQPPPVVDREQLPPQTDNKTETPKLDDNGLEEHRKQAWTQHWKEVEDVRKQHFDDRFKALTAMNTSVQVPRGHGNTAVEAAPSPTPVSASAGQGAPNFASLWGGGGGGYGGGLPGAGGFFPGLGPTPQIDREGQEQKIAFAGQTGDLGKNDEVPTRWVPPKPNAIMAGDVIKVTASNTAISDVPGTTLGKVSEPVYDTATGNCELIPQGTMVIGHYNSVVGTGQTRLPGVMTRLIFPGGSSQAIGAMEAADNAGAAGWEDEVDRHLLLKFGSAAVAGLFGAAIQLSVPQNGFQNGYNAQQVIGASLGQQMGQLGQQIAQQNLSIPNTLKIRSGYEYTIILDKDIPNMKPWRCNGVQRSSALPIMSIQ